jgi:hypothetical protein
MASDTSLIVAQAELLNYRADDADRPWALYEIAKIHQSRYLNLHLPEDLEAAQELYSEAAKTETDNSKKARYLNNLGIIFQYRYEATGDADDLHDFVKNTEEATLHAPDNIKPAILQNYANALQTRFYLEDDLDDLEKCIATYRTALSLSTANRPKICSSLCSALTTLFERNDDFSILEEACGHGEEAVDSTDDEIP